MKWCHRSYRIRSSSKMSIWDAWLLLIICISHQTIHIYNVTYINSHFELLKYLDDKMIGGKRNNDLNLSGDTEKWHINEHIFHTSNLHLPLYIKLTIDPIYFLLYTISNFLGCINDKIYNPQWFQFEWRMLKMTHKSAYFSYTQYFSPAVNGANALSNINFIYVNIKITLVHKW